jgi:protein O-mannosyl-transferase
MELDSFSFWKRYKYFVALTGIGFLVYFNSLFGTFVWDDISQIQDNYLVHSLSNIVSFFLGSTFAPQNSNNLGGIYYRPIMTTVFSILYTLYGQQTFFYHLFQLSLHIFNATLLFYLIKKIFKEQLAFFLSLVFLIHPINVESVAYISTLGEPLFFFFGIIAFILFEKGKVTTKKNIMISFLLLCSLLSKETGVLFGIMLFFYYLFFNEKSFKKTVTIIALTIIPIGIYLFLRFFIAKVFLEKIPDVPMMTAPLIGRILTMPAIFFFYIKTFFFPKDLFIYQEWMISQTNSDFYLPLFIDAIFLLTLCGIGIWIWKTNKKLFCMFFFFCLWLLLGIGFHMQLLPLDMTVADHMFYFPMIGLLGIIGLVMQNIKQLNYNVRIQVLLFAFLILCILSVRTLVRNTNWYNGISLYSHDLQYQQNDRVENLLAGELIASGSIPEARKHYEILLSKNPDEPVLFANLGKTYELEGNLQKAEKTYQKGLQIDNTGTIYAYYANALLSKEGKIKEAKEISNQGLMKFPQNTSLLIINAVATYKIGGKQNALDQLQKAKSTSTDPRIDQIYQAIQNGNLNL